MGNNYCDLSEWRYGTVVYFHFAQRAKSDSGYLIANALFILYAPSAFAGVRDGKGGAISVETTKTHQ